MSLLLHIGVTFGWTTLQLLLLLGTICCISILCIQALDQLGSLQGDLAQSVKEFGVMHKQYTEDEIIAYEARNKADVAGQK